MILSSNFSSRTSPDPVSFWRRRVARVGAFVLAAAAVYVLPWWISAPFIFLLSLLFPFYVEILFFGFLFDILYSTSHYALAISTAIFFTILAVRSRLRR